MSTGTKIEWTEATWPVTTGCTEVSSGCDLCYAARLTSGRLKHLPEYAGLAVDGKFTGEVRVHPHRLDWPLRWRKPRRIFVASMSDLFHEKVPDEFIARVFVVISSARQHTFQVLTKRHGRMRSLLSAPRFQVLAGSAGFDFNQEHKRTVGWTWPLPNVWLGVSVENQQWADIRIPALLDTPAAVRWLSVEPLLGPVALEQRWLTGGDDWSFNAECLKCGTEQNYDPDGHPIDHHCDDTCSPPPDYKECDRWGQQTGWCDEPQWSRYPRLSWVVVGGESGPGARPMHPDWARSLRDQCRNAGVPFFFKQWGGRTPKAGGRELDGREWNEYPARYIPDGG